MSPVDLVHANRFNPAQLAIRQALLHEPLHGSIHRFPTGSKYCRRLPPTQSPLSVAPRNVLNHDPVLSTLPPPRSIQEDHRYSPQRYKFPVTLRQPVIAWSRETTLRATCPDSTVSRHAHLDPLCFAAQKAHPHVLVDESDKPLHPIQNGLNL